MRRSIVLSLPTQLVFHVGNLVASWQKLADPNGFIAKLQSCPKLQIVELIIAHFLNKRAYPCVFRNLFIEPSSENITITILKTYTIKNLNDVLYQVKY